MFNRSMILALSALFVFSVNTPPAQAGNNRLVGVWHIQASRAGSPVTRPVLMTFHADGTMQYSSSTNINTLATLPPHLFFGRGGGVGVYRPVRGPANTYAAESEELLYDEAGNAKGRFLVAFTLTVPRHPANTLSGSYRFRITSFTPEPLGLNDAITGEQVQVEGGPGNGALTGGYPVTQSCFFTGKRPCYDGPADTAPQP